MHKTIPLLVALAISVNQVIGQQTRLREYDQVFRTYGFDDPSPVVNMGTIYPYNRFDGYTNAPTDQSWRIVELENPYIKVLIAPEIGGKVLGAVEKSTGKAFLYYNKVVKFRDIAMRGAWTSGGIEFNFGSIGHAPTTASPVDYFTRQNEDGSASCFVGAMDLTHRTHWTVEIRLDPDKAYFETRGTWHNPNPLGTSLYHWSNAAAAAGDDLVFYYPGTSYIGHGGDDHPYPIDQGGIDISRYGNNTFGGNKSYHVIGRHTDYFGGYWEASDFGFVHWSPYQQKPGKKIWMWSTSREGAIWEDLLTDKDLGNRQYVEIQSGLLFNQAGSNSTFSPFKHLEFPSDGTVLFEEIWAPVLATGGIAEATPTGVLNVMAIDGQLEVRLCPLQSLRDTLSVRVEGELTYQKALDLQALETYVEQLDIPLEADFTIVFGDDLIRYSSINESRKELSRPTALPEAYDWESLWVLYTRGIEWIRQRRYREASQYIEQCLARDPFFVPALTARAELRARKMEYGESLADLKQVLAIDTYQPKANYLYGWVHMEQGDWYNALDGFALASRSLEYRSSALARMGQVYLLMGLPERAIAFLQESLDYDAGNYFAKHVLLATLRMTEHAGEAQALADHMLTDNPLDHRARYEQYLLSGMAVDLATFRANIKSEFPWQTYTELAAQYLGIGEDQTALRVLEDAPENSLTLLWRSWLEYRLGNDQAGRDLLDRALTLSVAYMFPFRLESAEMLKFLRGKVNHWKLDYYMGLVQWSRDRGEDAQSLFKRCGNDPDFAPFYLSRYHLLKGAEGYNDLADLQRAIELDPSQWRGYQMLATAYSEHGDHPGALRVLLEACKKFEGYYVLEYDLAKAWLNNGDYTKCLEVLDNTVILPNEGARGGRQIYRQACIMQALDLYENGKRRAARAYVDRARLWPENLGVGKPYDADQRIEDFLTWWFLGKGSSGKDGHYLDSIVAYTEHVSSMTASNYFTLAALDQQDRQQQAEMLLSSWVEAAPDDLSIRWCEASFHNKQDEVEVIEQQMNLQKDSTPYETGQRDPDLFLVRAIIRTLEL